MSSISLNQACVQFPVYQGGSRSFRKTVLRATTGGLIRSADGEHIVVDALKNITFELKAGDRLGLIGGNGAGKTTLLRVLAKIYEPVSGSVISQGSITPMFDIGLGIDPEATGYENIMIRGMFLGLSKAEIRRNLDDIVAFTGLGDFLHMPVRTYSAGMGLRLAFAVSTSIQSEILLMDEWIIAGDASFMDKANHRLGALVNNAAILVLASHADHIVEQWCNKAIWLDRGEMRAFGETKDIMRQYKESYQAA